MSEELKPGAVEQLPAEPAADVAQTEEKSLTETIVEKVAEVSVDVEKGVEDVKEVVVNYGEKTLAELSSLFQELTESADRLKRSKEAEAIKSAFYKRLSREKAEAGLNPAVEEPSADAEPVETPVEAVAEDAVLSPFAAIEADRKSVV